MDLRNALSQLGMVTQALVSAFFVLNHPAATEQTKEAARQLRSELQARLGPDQLEAAQAKAQDLPLESLVASILDYLSLDSAIGLARGLALKQRIDVGSHVAGRHVVGIVKTLQQGILAAQEVGE